jgi:hypothetical protein
MSGRSCGWSSLAEQRPLPGTLGVERLGDERADRLAAAPAGLHDPGRAELAEVPADERLGQAYVIDELRHCSRAVRQALDDAQPVDVGEGLVEAAQLAQVVGLVDDRGDRGPDAGGRG